MIHELSFLHCSLIFLLIIINVQWHQCKTCYNYSKELILPATNAVTIWHHSGRKWRWSAISCFRESFNFLIVAISSKCNISIMESKSINLLVDLFGVDMIMLKVWPVGHAEFTFLCETHQMVRGVPFFVVMNRAVSMSWDIIFIINLNFIMLRGRGHSKFIHIQKNHWPFNKIITIIHLFAHLLSPSLFEIKRKTHAVGKPRFLEIDY